MQTELLKAAQAVMQNAYAPYSKFKVGASLLSTDHKMYVGCNVENASYGLTQCAEGNAIAALVAAGSQKIAEVLIVSSGEMLCPPCGACRQKLAEFSTAETRVHLCTAGGEFKTLSLAELLPFSFGTEVMKHD